MTRFQKSIEDLAGVLGINVPENAKTVVTGLAYNSKEVKAGDAFFCIPGEKFDGNKFIPDVVQAGAVLVVSEKDQPADLKSGVAYFKVECVREAMGRLAAYFYDNPSTKLRLLGVTGTNGKTTTTHIVEHVLNACGHKTALIGTMGVRWPGPSRKDFVDTHHTTPQSIDLQRLLAQMVDDGVTHAAMEVSSHALFLKRVEGCQFTCAGITNLTQDHLDFHKTMDHYRQSKILLWDLLSLSKSTNKSSIINLDDPSSVYFIQATPESAKLLTFGWNNNLSRERKADFSVTEASYSGEGTVIKLKTPESPDDVTMNLPLLGEFNVYNTLCAMAICFAEGVSLTEFQKAILNFDPVPGRFQLVSLDKQKNNSPICIVDYAHTPDGLEKILKAARPMVGEGKKLIVIFGCGGDRDATKRPAMAQVATQLADEIVITSDNPRSEDPEKIIADILNGVVNAEKKSVEVESDRKTAIHNTIAGAQPLDMVVVAGKGHETYQILKDRTIDFNDAEEIKTALKKRL